MLPIHSMQESDIEKSEQQTTGCPAPSLLNIIISSFAKQAFKLYEEKDYDAMDTYIQSIVKTTGISKIYDLTISDMVQTLDQGFIFANRLIKLYSENPNDVVTIKNFFYNFNDDAKVNVVGWIIEELCNLRSFDSKDPNKCKSLGKDEKYCNIEKDLIVNLLNLLIIEYQNADFNYKILEMLDNKYKTRSDNESNFTMVLAENQKDVSYQFNDKGILMIHHPPFSMLTQARLCAILHQLYVLNQHILKKIELLQDTIKAIQYKNSKEIDRAN